MVEYRDLLKKYMKYLEDHGALGDMFATEDLMVSDPQHHFDREEFKALVECHFEMVNARIRDGYGRR